MTDMVPAKGNYNVDSAETLS